MYLRARNRKGRCGISVGAIAFHTSARRSATAPTICVNTNQYLQGGKVMPPHDASFSERNLMVHRGFESWTLERIIFRLPTESPRTPIAYPAGRDPLAYLLVWRRKGRDDLEGDIDEVNGDGAMVGTLTGNGQPLV
jgi:hypothetical protein